MHGVSGWQLWLLLGCDENLTSGAAWYETPLGDIPMLLGAVLLTAYYFHLYFGFHDYLVGCRW